MSTDDKARDIFKDLNEIITSADPDSISSSWIINNAPKAYRHIHKNYRLDTGGIDWDTVTVTLTESTRNAGHGTDTNK